MLYLALLPEDHFASTREISGNTGVSDGYLEQLFIPLRKAGIIRGIRGAQGGYLPGKPAAEIRVGDILRAVEGSLEPVVCLESKVCAEEEKCITRHTWAQLYREIGDCVDSITLGDLAENCKQENVPEYSV
jgi:Rrf2 family protein